MNEGHFAFRRELYLSDKLGLIGGPLTVITAGAFLALLVKGSISPANIDGDGHGPDSPRYVASLTADKRVEHDFASTSSDSGDDCQEQTGYDPLDYKKHGDARKAHTVGTVSLADRLIRIVPGAPHSGQPPLELIQNSGDKPLQPANPAATAILSRFGCELKY